LPGNLSGIVFETVEGHLSILADCMAPASAPRISNAGVACLWIGVRIGGVHGSISSTKRRNTIGLLTFAMTVPVHSRPW